MANKEAKLKVVVDAENRTQRVFNGLQRDLDGIAKANYGLADTMKSVGTAGTIAFGALSLMTKGIIEAGAGFEQTQIAFETMLGSAELAQKTLSDLSQFAAKTPFELGQLESASKQLLAYGTSAEDLIPTLKMLGDITAGVGMDKLPQLILAFGQVKAATKLTGAELRQFTEAGVPLLEALVNKANEAGGVLTKVGGTSEKTAKQAASLSAKIAEMEYRMKVMTDAGKDSGVTWEMLNYKYEEAKKQLAAIGPIGEGTLQRVRAAAADMIEKISEGEVSFEEVKAAMAGMTGEGGKFFNLMEKQSQSLAGQWSNLKDQISLTARSIGEELLPYLKPVVEKLIEIAQSIGAFVKEHPKLSAFLLMAALGFTALAALLLPLALALPGLILMFSGLATAIGLVTAVSAPVLLAVGSVIAILGVLVSQGYFAKEAWQDVWLGIKLFAAEGANAVINVVEGMLNFVISGVNKAIDAINRVIQAANRVPGVNISTVGKIDDFKLDRFDTELIASNDLNARSAAGTQTVINVSGNTFLDEYASERIGDLILKRLKMSNAL